MLDYFSEICQWKIDFLCLFKNFSFCTRFRYLLWPSQIYQKKFTGFWAWILIVKLIKAQQKNHMWPWRVFIHVSYACYSVLLTDMNQLEKLGFVTDIDLSKILNIRPHFILPNFQVAFADIEQITNFLHVDLENWDFQFILNGICGFFNSQKKFFYLYFNKMYYSWHYAFCLFISHIVALHGMCFSRAGLSICHNGSVESIKDVLKYRETNLLKDFLLIRCDIKCMIEHEWYFINFFAF